MKTKKNINTTQFSKIIAGTMTWGVWGKDYSTKQMIELMNCCLENNITSFDHADIYGDYTTESAFGYAFNESKIDRNKIQLISKCGIQLKSEKRKNSIKHYNYSASYIIASVEQSLRNLRTDYLDLLLLHRPSPLMKVEEITEAVEKLKNDGKILDFGVSNFTPEQIDLIETKTKISFNQIKFSITDHEAMLNGSLDHMQTNKITPMCWSPLGTVFKQDDEKSQQLKNLATSFSHKYNVPMDVIFLAWILKHPSGILPVFGTTNQLRIAELMKATNVEMEVQDWFELWTASLGVPVP